MSPSKTLREQPTPLYAGLVLLCPGPNTHQVSPIASITIYQIIYSGGRLEGRRNLRDSAKKEVDYLALAEQWFGSAAAADKLRSAIFEVARQAHDSAEYGSPAQRKSKLASTARAAAKLKQKLAELDATTRVRLFGGRRFSDATDDKLTTMGPAAAAENASSVEDLVAFEVLLSQMVESAKGLAKHTPRQTAGAMPLPDAITFGIECLASFWRKYRPDVPTSGQNHNSFGYLAETILCAEPVRATRAQVRTALRYHFRGEEDTKEN